MEGVNSFEKGLHRSNSPQEQPEGSYVDALNWVRNDSGRLVNEELEEALQNLGSGYEYLGSCSVNNSFVCFFKKGTSSEIGIFEGGVYKQVFNDSLVNPSYSLNFTNSIDSVARINNKGDIIVYFVEKDKTPRRFNIDEYERNPSKYNDVVDWDLQLSIKIPHPVLTVNNTGGALSSGTYSVVLRYRTDINNKSTFGIPSRMVYLTDDSGSTSTDDGCPPGTQTSKSITITPTNIDNNYPYIEPIIITYVGNANILTIKSLGIYPNDGTSINFVDEGQYQDSVPLEEILENPIFYDSAECIEQKDNILIISNLKGKKYDRDFQEVANNIEVHWYIQTTFNEKNIKDIKVKNGLNYDGREYNPTAILPNPEYNEWQHDFFERIQNSSITLTNNTFPFKQNDKKGFTRGEVYSFSITPIYKDGTIGFAYHIPAKDVPDSRRTSIYQSQEFYPDYLKDDLDFASQFGEKVRHHKMPDYDGNTTATRCPNIEDGILRVKFKNISFTTTQQNAIQGYIIGYQQRDSDLNTRVIDSGWVKPYIANGNYFRNSFFNGSSYFKYQSNADMTYNLQDKGLMYYSPDTEALGKELNTSYKIQFIGWARNVHPIAEYFPAAASNYGSRNLFYTDIYQALSYFKTASIFEHFTTIRTIRTNYPTSNLNHSIFVPAIGENFKTVLGKYRLEFTKNYYHLETSVEFFTSLIDWEKYYSFFNPDTNTRTPVYRIFARSDGGDDRVVIVNGYANTDYEYIPLVRIINDITTQYGRLERAKYIPSEVIFDLSSSEVEVEGDTFLTKYFHHNFDGFRNNFNGGDDEGYHGDGDQNHVYTFPYIAGILYESKNNYHLRHYDAANNEVPYFPKETKLHSTTTTNPGIIDYEWWKRSIGYNRQYSAINNFKAQFPKPFFFEEVVDYSNRSIYSTQSFENELVDQYRYFPALQYHDIPKNRGIITDTFVFNNNFFHHTEYGLWLSYFNPNTTQTTSQGEVVLGNAGIFRIPSKLILDIKGGYMGTMDKSGTNTPFGRIFLDHNQGKIFLFAGDSPVEISDLGLFSFFREFVNTNDKYSMGYDWANKRLLISNITQEKAISFYPKTQTWTSLHDFAPKAYLTINGFSFAYNNNSFWNLNNSKDIRKNSYITFVENTQPDGFKRFDRIEMNTMSGGIQGISKPGSIIEPNDYVFLDKSFTHIHAWTDRQNTTELPFAYSQNFEDNFLSNYKVDEVPVNYYRSSFHAELPLDAVLDPYKNIFDTNNTDINADFRAHMKGKFLYTKLSYKDDKPLVLNYIKTFFKPSVA
jgi:hypothetical protein